MNKILILAALMLTGCDRTEVTPHHYIEIDSSGYGVGVVCVRINWKRVKCASFSDENVDEMQALADELNGLEK